jgi:hypothetical protein
LRAPGSRSIISVMRVSGVGASVLVLLGVGSLFLPDDSGARHARTPATAAAKSAGAPRPCKSALRRGVLPRWARTGFSSPRPRLPHVVGRKRRIAALIFGDPLFSPPARRRSNKILWVSRLRVKPTSDLVIHAQRMRGARRIGAAVKRKVDGGPGPSIIDLPAPGCWRLSLAWSGHRDKLDLRYRKRD